jgi:transcriptional regulator with PAS, ATPase and Fis domain
MRTWPSRIGTVLQLLDPAEGPRLVLDRVWAEVSAWQAITGIWLRCRPGHLRPAGTFAVGRLPDDVMELAKFAGPLTAPLSNRSDAIGRELRDGNVPIASLIISHHQADDAASLLVDILARYCMDRLRLQLEVSELSEENSVLREALRPTVHDHDIVTVSGTMHAVIESAVRAAASTATVLIHGETGTGKELLARLIHSHSPRASRVMVSVNAGALSPTLLESELFGHVRGAYTGADHDRKGVFEVAHGGTLFLDEVAEISMQAQVKLLRVLQERTISRVGDNAIIPVDVRIIAATHRDLAVEVANGRFREDLFYRLNVVNLTVPPLRNRPEDVPILINHFLQRFNRINYKQVEEVPRQVLDMLCRYSWPGNVRELENCVHKAVVLAPGTVFLEELVPPTMRGFSAHHPADDGAPGEQSGTLQSAIERHASRNGPHIERCFREAERILINYALNQARGVKLRAAQALGINRVTLDRKLVEHGIVVKRGAGVVGQPLGRTQPAGDAT